MLIRVTQADIDAGSKSDSRLCPIACAINRALGSKGLDGAIVYRSQITPKIYHTKVQPTSCAVERFIVRFDHGLPVEPFNFRVRVESRF
jgi:hypothetical protein